MKDTIEIVEEAVGFDEHRTAACPVCGRAVQGELFSLAVLPERLQSIITQNVVDMLARFWVGSRDGSGDAGEDRVAWFVHPDAVSQLATLVITGAGTTYLLNTDTMRMLGFPVIAVEHCLPVGTEGV